MNGGVSFRGIHLPAAFSFSGLLGPDQHYYHELLRARDLLPLESYFVKVARFSTHLTVLEGLDLEKRRVFT